jgi:DNA-binding response OmpR family regulator
MSSALVLVVDDDTDTREILRVALATSGYRVVAVGGATEALVVLESQHPDLVLLDLVMPEVDGWWVVQHVAAMPSPPPIIVLSGVARLPPPTTLRPWLAGYMLKPFHVGRLLRACEHALKGHAAGAAVSTRSGTRYTFLSDATLQRVSGERYEGQLHEVSRGGFRVDVATDLQVGEDVRLSVRVPWEPERIPFTGRVRWGQQGLYGVQAAVPAEHGPHVERLLGRPGQ